MVKPQRYLTITIIHMCIMNMNQSLIRIILLILFSLQIQIVRLMMNWYFYLNSGINMLLNLELQKMIGKKLSVLQPQILVGGIAEILVLKRNIQIIQAGMIIMSFQNHHGQIQKIYFMTNTFMVLVVKYKIMQSLLTQVIGMKLKN